MPGWLAHRGACYACAGTATGDCRLCGSDTCPDHAARLPGSGLAACLDCHRALGAPGASPSVPTTHCVLIADDSFRLRLLLARALQLQGFEVLEAIDGEKGVAMAAEQRPDLILMDIQLPIVDGYEATRRIKANPDLRHIPIIAVTSYALSGDDAKAFAAGCDGYFAKPFSPRVILAKVREFLT